MPRVEPITSKDQLGPEGQRVWDAVGESRGGVRGPFTILLYSPELCERVTNTGHYLRFESLVKPKEQELAIITVAREKDCQYVWGAHVEAARKGGNREEAIKAVREKGNLSSLLPEERAVITFVQQILRNNRVHQPVYDELQKRYGTQWLVELCGIIGHYSTMTTVLNTFEVTPPAEAEQLPV